MELGLIFVVAVLIAATIVAVRRRSAPDDMLAPWVPSVALEPVANPASTLMLVPLADDPSAALAVGSRDAIAELERAGLTRREDQQRSPIPQQVRRILGAGESRDGLDEARALNDDLLARFSEGRIVRLSDETAALLKERGPALDKTGRMLGVIRGDHGQFGHAMRLEEAGGAAVAATNAVTLAAAVAVMGKLNEIQESLEALRGTLDQLVADTDRARLVKIIAASDTLTRVAARVRDRGEITDADWSRISAAEQAVRAGLLEADFKLADVMSQIDPADLHRGEKVEAFSTLVGERKVEYWLALLAEAELAQNRWDTLHLLYETTHYPATAAALERRMREEIAERSQRLHAVGEQLRALVDPARRTQLDRLRVYSKWQLQSAGRSVDKILSRHGDVFSKAQRELGSGRTDS